MLRCTCTHAGCYARKSSLALAHMQDVTLGDLSCTCTHAGCYARKSSLALAHMQDVTLGDLSCTCTHAGCYARKIFSCTCTHVGCCARRSPLALAHNVGCYARRSFLHMHTCGMLRYQIFFAHAHMHTCTYLDITKDREWLWARRKKCYCIASFVASFHQSGALLVIYPKHIP